MSSTEIILTYTLKGRELIKKERDFPLSYPTFEKAKRAAEILVTKNPTLTLEGRAVHPRTGSSIRVASGTTLAELFPLSLARE